jgi:beta-N-acetylhexosaminidase
MSLAACALGIREAVLSAHTRDTLKELRPWALILFREACVDPVQTRALCEALREAVGHDALIWIDQEGGRVARLKRPNWPTWPAAWAYGALYAQDAALGVEASRLGHRLIAHELKALGVNGNFAPVLDVPVSGSDPIIGDRAFSQAPESVAALAQAALDGLHAGGVAGCIKHIPGHGRADVDSHLALPQVREGRNALGADFAPFRALKQAEAAMTAHIVFSAIDPDRPATHSPVMLDLIRTDIGFSGLLMSDDLDMKALSGTLMQKAERAFAAGVDLVLQCNGVAGDMAAVAEGVPVLSGLALARAQAVEKWARAGAEPLDAAGAWWRLRQLMGPAIRAAG